MLYGGVTFFRINRPPSFIMGQEFGLVASGSWEINKSKKRKTIGSWTDEVSGEMLLFEFKNNGQIKLYSDQNKNGKINRRKDILIGGDKYSNSYDKRYYNRNHFMLMSGGKIEVEGFINENNVYEAYYSIRLDSGVDMETDFGSTLDVNKYVDVKDNDFLTSVFQPEIT